MDLKELESGVDPSNHWYYQAKKVPLFKYFRELQQCLGAPVTIIDFGAGSGFFSRELFRTYPDAIREVLLVDIGYTQDEINATKNTRVKKLHEMPRDIDNTLVVMMDVLEHLPDDLAILREVRDRLGSNAYFFITVPAFMSLWSGHDVVLGHYRRYRLGNLRELLDSCGCRTTCGYYMFASIFPLVWLVRRWKNFLSHATPKTSDMKPVKEPLNTLLKSLMQLEMRCTRWNQICGITAVAEGRIK